MMKQINFLQNWNFARILRLVLGIAFGVNAIITKDVPFAFLALILIVQAWFNLSCCGVNGCSVPNDNESKKPLFKGQIKPYKPQ